MTRLRRSLTLAAALVALGLISAASASAAVKWDGSSVSNTAAASGESIEFAFTLTNLGDTDSSGTTVITATFPTGLTPTGGTIGFFTPCGMAGQVVTCEISETVQVNGKLGLTLLADVNPDAASTETVHFEVTGGGAPVATQLADPVRISAEDPPFGFDAFDALASDATGEVFSNAGGHPDEYMNWIDFNLHTDPLAGPRYPVEDARDVFVNLPSGFVGSVASVDRCTLAELANGSAVSDVRPLCSSESQLGIATFRIDLGQSAFVAVYNLDPPPGAPARFGMNLAGTLVILDTSVVSDGGYHLRVGSANIPQGLAIDGNTFKFWGVPSASGHYRQRSCPGVAAPSLGGESCLSNTEPRAFFRNPTSCDSPDGLSTTVTADSWQVPGDFVETSIRSHDIPGYPFPPSEWGPAQGIEGCDQVPFEPTIATVPTTDSADSPTGLSVDVAVPQTCWDENEVGAICHSDMKKAAVTLPQGLSVNPAAASGRQACSPDQVGLTSAAGQASAEFDEVPVSCPDASKLGTVEVTTPLLHEPLGGALYLAQQGNNPFGSLLAVYLVIEGQGVRIKQAGEISLAPGTGRVTTTFSETPQLPFSKLHLELFGGPRAALRTPPTCGTYTTQAELTPWARPDEPVSKSSSFQITEGCGGGFDPKLSAGTENPLAGTYSPFSLRLTREDGNQELAGLRLTVPKGLLANLKGIPYCSDQTLTAISGDPGTGQGQIDSPSCPAASAVGTVTVGAGAGSTPFYTSTGRAYWAGPYKGAPVSLAVVVPAVAGPFDLGSVVVRNGFEVNPETAQITAVADPFPSVLHGIPLDLRDVRVQLNRPNYTLNPTSCEPMSFDSTITSTQGATATPSERFQVAGCDQLAFKPKLSLRLKGKTNRGAHPALRAVLTMPQGGANIARAAVTLPRTELLDQSHIRTVCTRVQFAAAQCPAGSIYGYASAYSPILDYYLQGPVYLRSSDNQLPDLVASLGGQIQIDVVGRVDSVKGRLRTTFESVPDAPVSKFVLNMQGGKKGLLVNETELCATKAKATALFDGQNGKLSDSRPLVRADCEAARKGKRAQRRGGR